jgi:hypothetical protein
MSAGIFIVFGNKKVNRGRLPVHVVARKGCLDHRYDLYILKRWYPAGNFIEGKICTIRVTYLLGIGSTNVQGKDHEI